MKKCEGILFRREVNYSFFASEHACGNHDVPSGYSRCRYVLSLA